MSDHLKSLADKLGIVTQFSDAGLVKKDYYVNDDVIQFFAERFGYAAKSDDDISKSLEKFENKRWQKALEAIYVCEQGDMSLDVVIPEKNIDDFFNLKVRNHLCKEGFDISFDVVDNGLRKQIGKTPYVKLNINITSDLEVGYYEVNLTIGEKKYKTTLAVAPKECYKNPHLDNKIWGYAIQLYSVKSERNWGVGDFTDLRNMVRVAKNSGADVIGINPLNVLSHDFPENASPYSSISRLFLNPIYIDVEAVKEFQASDLDEISEELAQVRATELIEYGKVYPLKIRVLEKLYKRFLASKDKERTAEFKSFCKSQGKELEALAVFQTLYSEKKDFSKDGWTSWEEEFKNPNSKAVKDYAKANEERLGFFKFLQFEADRQFNNAQKLVEELGLKVGFYRDLAVSVGRNSVEYWSDPDLFIADAGVGAPPDAFFPTGQKWGLSATNPEMLKEKCYEPLIKILRANMIHAGALRIDHVMGLMRLYIIPDNKDFGTYIMFNFKDMLNIVALESYLNKCTIVGESIGNVPDGFLDALHRKNIYSLSVLWAERKDAGWGDFLPPYEYPVNAFTSISTHDMPPLRMWWFGYDIALSRSLNMIPSDEEMNEAYKKRELDRWKLLFALDSNNVWPEDNQRKANYIYGEAYPEGFEEAVHRFVARSASTTFLAQLEDILHVEKLQNLPGTDKEHPNWRRKLPVSLEKLERDIAFIRNINAIRKER